MEVTIFWILMLEETSHWFWLYSVHHKQVTWPSPHSRRGDHTRKWIQESGIIRYLCRSLLTTQTLLHFFLEKLPQLQLQQGSTSHYFPSFPSWIMTYIRLTETGLLPTGNWAGRPLQQRHLADNKVSIFIFFLASRPEILFRATTCLDQFPCPFHSTGWP